MQVFINQLISKCEISESLSLNRNQFLKTEGTTDTNLYFVEEGCLRIYMMDQNQEHTIRFGYAGNLITALDSYISEKPSDLCIQAIRKSKIHQISKKDFQAFINGSEALKTMWNQLLEQLIFQQLERERDLLTSSPEERYKRVLQRSPQLFQEVPHKYIASYLRMSPETLSRIKKS